MNLPIVEDIADFSDLFSKENREILEELEEIGLDFCFYRKDKSNGNGRLIDKEKYFIEIYDPKTNETLGTIWDPPETLQRDYIKVILSYVGARILARYNFKRVQRIRGSFCRKSKQGKELGFLLEEDLS